MATRMPKHHREQQGDKPGDALGRYRGKRRAGATPEPSGRAAPGAGAETPLFVVQQHRARAPHFEGRIPQGSYGAGWVIVWDRGTYRPLADPRRGLERGKLLFELDGVKLRSRTGRRRSMPSISSLRRAGTCAP